MKNLIITILALAVTVQCTPLVMTAEAEDLETRTADPEQNNTAVTFDTLSEEEMKDPAELLAGSAKMYLNQDTELRQETEFPAASLETLGKREEVQVLKEEGDQAEVMSRNGQVGWIPESVLTESLNGIFDDTDVTMYASESEVPVYASWQNEDNVIGSLKTNDQVQVTGDSTGQYLRVSYNNTVGYINQDLLRDTPVTIARVSYGSGAPVSYTYDGSVLSPSAGSVYGPSGRETYYNLDMSGVISAMRAMGFDEANYPYSVRSDGAKMLGPYIMVAANLNSHPKGSTMETSMGTGIVADTGGFAYSGSGVAVDIATAW
jgi:hypothetical protein